MMLKAWIMCFILTVVETFCETTRNDNLHYSKVTNIEKMLNNCHHKSLIYPICRNICVGQNLLYSVFLDTFIFINDIWNIGG